MSRISKVLVLIAGSIGLCVTPLAQAMEGVDSQRDESVGVVAGMAVGALLGGPGGAVLAAAAGAVVGEQVAVRRNHRLLQAELAASTQALAQQQLALQKRLYERELVASTAVPPPATPVDPQAVVLHFRSNSTELEAHYQDALLRFVRESQKHPTLVVGIVGHADRRGDATSNLMLSQRRVEAVMTALRELGLAAATYKTVAFGEQQPVSSSGGTEVDFFDRRVEVRMQTAAGTLLSSTAP